jgi:hypothetical protein
MLGMLVKAIIAEDKKNAYNISVGKPKRERAIGRYMTVG